MALGTGRNLLVLGSFLKKSGHLRNVSCSSWRFQKEPEQITTTTVAGRNYPRDAMTNIHSRTLELMQRRLHRSPGNPLCHLKQRLVKYLHRHYTNNRGNPQFSIFEDMSPVVTLEQNFDSLLTPPDHVSRAKGESYYLNSEYLLRAHTSAHQAELLRSGLNAFAVVGDVYRRDAIDATHYPVFHQMEGLKLYTSKELFGDRPDQPPPSLFTSESDATPRHLSDTTATSDTSPQACHSPAAVEAVSKRLKQCLEGMAASVFGKDVKYRWVAAHFPFTQPSWELEVWHGGAWLEVLGCGVVHQRILTEAGVTERMGWAFGLGLERWAMAVYGVPDIRLFWSTDPGVTSQFAFDDPETPVTYVPVSKFTPRPFDLSLWLLAGRETEFCGNDLSTLVREVAGDLVEQVVLRSVFVHPKTGLTSHCYRIVYRSMERSLDKPEAQQLHSAVTAAVSSSLPVTLCV